jgi:hypothetical protein
MLDFKNKKDPMTGGVALIIIWDMYVRHPRD